MDECKSTNILETKYMIRFVSGKRHCPSRRGFPCAEGVVDG